MTQNQIDRLRECKKKAMELESELKSISTEMSDLVFLDNNNDAHSHNSKRITAIYVMAYNLSLRLNATIL
jgi:hypothetical protein